MIILRNQPPCSGEYNETTIRRLHSDFKDSRSLRRPVGRKAASVFTAFAARDTQEKSRVRCIRISNGNIYRIYSPRDLQVNEVDERKTNKRINNQTEYSRTSFAWFFAPFFASRRVVSLRFVSRHVESLPSQNFRTRHPRISHSVGASLAPYERQLSGLSARAYTGSK